jgi:hypothetical protein
MTIAALAIRAPLPRVVRPTVRAEHLACWAFFVVAAVVFATDAATTIHVLAVQPLAVEANPIARWTLEAHPIAPFVLKAAIILECAVIAHAFRRHDERWAAWFIGLAMLGFGVFGIATAVVVGGA